jgi:hypothetical protein
MFEDSIQNEFNEVFHDIIEGRTVKRSRHQLRWGMRDVTLDFVAALNEHGYTSTTVAAIPIEPGERVPAFFIEGDVAYFGWVFWEKFSHLRLRKLFGSVVKNPHGDWEIQISPKRLSVIYANLNLRSDMDIDNPSGF